MCAHSRLLSLSLARSRSVPLLSDACAVAQFWSELPVVNAYLTQLLVFTIVRLRAVDARLCCSLTLFCVRRRSSTISPTSASRRVSATRACALHNFLMRRV